MFTSEHLEKMQTGLQLFNEKKYWECHEEFEDLWLEDRGDPVRNVYWAIIQVAASLFHVRNGKIQGARGLLKKAKETRRCRQKWVCSSHN